MTKFFWQSITILMLSLKDLNDIVYQLFTANHPLSLFPSFYPIKNGMGIQISSIFLDISTTSRDIFHPTPSSPTSTYLSTLHSITSVLSLLLAKLHHLILHFFSISFISSSLSSHHLVFPLYYLCFTSSSMSLFFLSRILSSTPFLSKLTLSILHEVYSSLLFFDTT